MGENSFFKEDKSHKTNTSNFRFNNSLMHCMGFYLVRLKFYLLKLMCVTSECDLVRINSDKRRTI